MRPGWKQDGNWYWYFVDGKKRAAIHKSEEYRRIVFKVMGRPYGGSSYPSNYPGVLEDAQIDAEEIVARGGGIHEEER